MAYKTLQDFPTELFEAWEVATHGKLHVFFSERGMATSFRHRMYRFRLMLRKQSAGSMSAKYDPIQLGVVPTEGGWAVVNETSDWKLQVRKLMQEIENDKPTTQARLGYTPDSSVPAGGDTGGASEVHPPEAEQQGQLIPPSDAPQGAKG